MGKGGVPDERPAADLESRNAVTEDLVGVRRRAPDQIADQLQPAPRLGRSGSKVLARLPARAGRI
jgi:hypothetical protein